LNIQSNVIGKILYLKTNYAYYCFNRITNNKISIKLSKLTCDREHSVCFYSILHWDTGASKEISYGTEWTKFSSKKSVPIPCTWDGTLKSKVGIKLCIEEWDALKIEDWKIEVWPIRKGAKTFLSSLVKFQSLIFNLILQYVVWFLN